MTTPEEKEKQARLELIRAQARHDPVCAEYLAMVAINNLAGGATAWIETQLDFEEEENDFRPY